MNRTDFQQLTEVRLAEAMTLLDNAHYAGAYYLAGYAVECALKSCICRRTGAEDFPLDRKALENVYTHDLDKLLKGAELSVEHGNHMKGNQAFAVNWAIVKDWSEDARYQNYTEQQAREVLQAISDPEDEVLRWLQTFW